MTSTATVENGRGQVTPPRGSSPLPPLTPPPGSSYIGPDNRCCFCLTLRSGTIIVGVVNFLVVVLGFTWFSTSPRIRQSLSFADMHLSVLGIFGFLLVSDVVLILGACKRNPFYVVPWLCANSVLMGILLVLIAFFLILGYLNLNLEYDEYVTVLSLLGCLTAGHLFSCLVVFQFRKNLLEEIAIERQRSGAGNRAGAADPSAPEFDDLPQRYVRPPSPPPTYEEAAKVAAASVSNGATIEGKITGEKSAANEAANPGSEKLKFNAYETESPPEYASAIAASAMQDLAILRSKIMEASEVDGREVEVSLRQGDGNADEFGLLLGDLNEEDEVEEEAKEKETSDDCQTKSEGVTDMGSFYLEASSPAHIITEKCQAGRTDIGDAQTDKHATAGGGGRQETSEC